nr:amino acid adenylation domain-containing protein [Bacteroidota bacterium]
MLLHFFEVFNAFGDRTAFVIKGVKYTYSDFLGRISAIDSAIKNTNAGKDGILAICTPDHIDTYASIFSTWLNGFAYVPLDPGLPAKRVESIISQTGIKVILSPEKEVSHWIGEGVKLQYTGSLPDGKGIAKVNNPDMKMPAYVLFTSGSTGIPKGVCISFGNLESYFRAFFDLGYRIEPHDRVLQMFSLGFDMSVMSFGAGLWKGATIYTVPDGAFKNMEIMKLLADQKITVALMTPSVVRSVSHWLDEIHLPSLKYNIFAGEALPVELMVLWKKSLPCGTIHNIYGPTEALGCFNYDCPMQIEKSKSANGIISIGKPFPGMQARLKNIEPEAGAGNNSGELLIGGDQLMPGYWNNPDQNASAFQMLGEEPGKYYRTGDICTIDEDGDYFFLGRTDQQVKVDGHRVELTEIEYHLKSLPDVMDAIVIFDETASTGGRVMAFLTPATGEREKIRTGLVKLVPAYMVPHEFIFMDQFPVNQHDKTDRQKLIALVND